MSEPAHAVSPDSAPSRLLSRVHRLSVYAEDLENELEQVKRSRSWRITRPLRMARSIRGFLRSFVSFRPHLGYLQILSGVAKEGDGFRAISIQPSFRIISSKRRPPVGWVRIRHEEPPGPAVPERFVLYVDRGEGISEDGAIYFRLPAGGDALVKLPYLVRELRLDVQGPPDYFRLRPFLFKECWLLPVLLSDLAGYFRGEGCLGRKIKKLWNALRYGGMPAVWLLIRRGNGMRADLHAAYSRWVKRFDPQEPPPPACEDEEEGDDDKDERESGPLISIVMPVFDTPERWLREAIASVTQQTYKNWELCIADDASTRPSVATVLDAAAHDPRIRVRRRESNGHICAASNTALEMARGEFTALMDHDDVLSPTALEEVAAAMRSNPSAELFFSDEDRLDANGERRDPYFKEGFDEDLFLGQNLVSHLGVYRTETLRKIGGFRVGFEGSQDWDLALRFVEACGKDRIVHIPKVLYHWRSARGSVSYASDTKVDTFKAAERAIGEAASRRGLRAAVERPALHLPPRLRFAAPEGELRVLVLLWTGARNERLTKAMEALPRRFRLTMREIGEGAGLASAGDTAPGDLVLFLDPSLAPESGALESLLDDAAANVKCLVAGRVIRFDGALSDAGIRVTPGGELVPIHAGLPQGSPMEYFGRASLRHQAPIVRLDCAAIRLGEQSGFANAVPHSRAALPAALAAWARNAGGRVIWSPSPVFFRTEASDVRLDLSNDQGVSVDSDRIAACGVRANPNLDPDSPHFGLAFPPADNSGTLT